MFRIIFSEKEREMLTEDYFIYEIKEKRNNIVYWRCNVRSCPAKFKTTTEYHSNLANIMVTNNHNHISNPRDVLKKERVHLMKRKMEETLGTPRSIISTVLRGSNRTEIEATGTLDALSKMLREFRARMINPLPYLYHEMGISSLLAFSFRGEQLFQYGPGNYRGLNEYGDFALFYTNSMYETLKDAEVICVDGTFKVVPRPYFQLYTISYLRNNSVFPVIFALVKNKNQETYRNIFAVLNQLNGNLHPRIIKTDFEIASINALRLTFPTATISGCLFHLGQNIQRKLKELNLYCEYKTNPLVKKYVKALSALAFVQVEELESTFVLLRNSIEFPFIISNLYDFFYRVYIRNGNNTRFPIEIWNLHNYLNDNVPRTNNSIEGFHNVFNKSFCSANYTLGLLIKKIKDEEENIQQRRIRSDIGEIFCRKKKYVIMETRLNNFLISQTNHHGLEYIFGLIERLFY